VFNLPPASIYLGDSGSMVIGMAVGILSIQGALKTQATLAITAPAVVMTIPMLDTVLAIIRRKLTGQRIDIGDRGHIHHRLLERGLNNWQALGIIGMLCLMTGGSALAAIILRSEGLAWVVALSVIALLVRLQVFGHYEMSIVKLTVRARLKRLISRRNGISAEGLSAGMTFEQAWLTLVDEVKLWQGHQLEIAVGRSERFAVRRSWVHDDGPSPQRYRWTFEVTVGNGEQATCRLRVEGHDAHTAEPWYLLRVARILRTFGEHWSTRLEEITPAVIPLGKQARQRDEAGSKHRAA
jgi:UDP-GlcNAc:undecaprenyl-phosphate GlcNAc-1-phosphate transferase